MFNALKGIMNRVFEFIPRPTSQSDQRTLTSLKTNVSQEIKKTERKVRRDSPTNKKDFVNLRQDKRDLIAREKGHRTLRRR